METPFHFNDFSTALMRGTPGDIYLMSKGRALALNFGIFLTRDRSYFISPQLIHLGHAAELPHVLRQRCPSASIDVSSSAVRSICQSEAGGMVLAHALEADRLLKQAHRQAAAPRRGFSGSIRVRPLRLSRATSCQRLVARCGDRRRTLPSSCRSS